MTRKSTFLLLALLLGPRAHGQPTPPPASGDAPCEAEPVPGNADTVVSTPDAEGYRSLFNGKDFTGWWQSCQTHHSLDTVHGAVFRVDSGEKAIYSAQWKDTTGIKANSGGVLMTRRKYDHYELVFDFWPDYGNDAGLFNRTTAKGKSYETSLSYLGGGNVGGAWGEAGYLPRHYYPFMFAGSESMIMIGTSNATGYKLLWNFHTSRNNPAAYGCSTSGCWTADWPRLWDIDGWNQIKLRFYGGLDSSSAVRASTWFRKVGSPVWVPLFQDTAFVHPTPPGYIAFKVAGHPMRFGGPKGTWYRNIRLKPLHADGSDLDAPLANRPSASDLRIANFHVRYHPGSKRLELTFRNSSGPISVTAFSLEGRRVGTWADVGEKASWSTAGWAPGVYWIRAASGGINFVKRIILN